MATEKRVDNRVYFRQHTMPSKKSFKKMFLVESVDDLYKAIRQCGDFTEIEVCDYMMDKRKGYSREGVIHWLSSYAVIGTDNQGLRQNIGYVNKLIDGMPYKSV